MADPSLKDLAARTELRAIETLTLTDQQFLTGDKNGKTVTIAAQLRFPQGASRPAACRYALAWLGRPQCRPRVLVKALQ
jgi:hypothetical protein